MGFISRHIMSLVINSLGCGHTHIHARIATICTGSILRNYVRAGHRPALAGFKNDEVIITEILTRGVTSQTSILPPATAVKASILA